MGNKMHNDELMCDLDAVFVNLETHEVLLLLPKEHRCHMAGAISYAERIDPKVMRIMAYSGKREIVLYIKKISNDGVASWRAYDGKDVNLIHPAYKLIENKERAEFDAIIREEMQTLGICYSG